MCPGVLAWPFSSSVIGSMLMSSSLIFLAYKMGIMMPISSECYYKDEMNKMERFYKLWSVPPFKEKLF